MRIAGVDEAGRGPALGPMVIACVVVREEKLKALEKAGVRDSKILTGRRRRHLAEVIARTAEEVVFRIVSPEEIDKAVEGVTYRNLNYLEAGLSAQLIDNFKTPVDLVYIDSPDPKPERYALLIQNMLKKRKVKIIAENDADKKYTVVAAASIIAKVKRDSLIEEIAREYGDIGSGYPGDWRTVKFLEDWIREKGEPPPFARKSWKTVKKIVEKYRSRRII